MREQLKTLPGTATLLYDGWQVWDGHYWPVRAGGDLVASIEFAQRSVARPVEPTTELGIEQIDGCRYRATAKVLDTVDAVVLDLGAFRVLRWVRPGEGPGDFVAGDTVSLDLNLALNGWPDSPWTNRAAELYGTEHRWHIIRILRFTQGSSDVTEITEAAMETVESSGQYCLLECSLIS